MKKFKNFLLFVLSLVFTSLISEVYAQWIPTNGLYAGEIHSVITSNNEIIVGTNQIYKSADEGKTWFVSNNGIPSGIGAIRALVKIGSNIVAGSGDGVYYSTDNGDNWTQSAGTASLNVGSMVVKGANLFLSTWGSGIYKSTNNGVTWSACNTGITTPLVDMRGMAVKGTDIYAGSDGHGIFKSTNDGDSWSTVNTGLPGSYYSVSALAVVGNNIIAGTYGAGVYKSTNNGGSWSAVNNGISSTDMIMAMSVNGTSIYASTLTGNLYKTTDYINWDAVSVGTFTATRFEAFYSTGNEFYVGCWGFGSPEKSYGVFKTTDDGTTWKHIGIIDQPVSVLEVSGTNILAGTYDVTGNSFRTALYKTTEADSVWKFNIGSFDGQNISALKAAAGNVVYLFDDKGSGSSQVYRSTNNGNNWTSTGYNVLYNNFNTFVTAGTIIYAGNNSSSSEQVSVSSDNGATWNIVSNGIPTSAYSVYSLVIKGTTIFAATNNGIYKNTVGQNAWTSVNSGLTNLIVKSLYVSGTIIYAGTQGGGIFKSANDGGLWTDANTGIPVFTNVMCFASSVSNVFAGTDNGVFVTANSGSSWTNVNTGLVDTTITTMTASANYLWAGTYSQGVWRRELSQLVASVPPTPGVITGSTTVCQGSTNTYSVTVVSGATSYTWTLPNGWTGTSTSSSINATAGSSGTISVTANNSFGSSAPQTLNVTVTAVNVSVTQSGLTLTANANGAGYVWLNCNGFTVVSGQTSQSFTATTVGNYAVVVTQNGCADTSACFTADTTCNTSMTGLDLPHTGLSVLLKVDTLTNVSLGSPGVSQSWNYSSLSYQYIKYAVYDATSTSPYASTFPTSNIYTYGPGAMFGGLFGGAPVGSGDNGYVFWKSDNTGLWIAGFRPDGGMCAGINVHDIPQELLIGVPASYGSVFNNSARWELPMNGNTSNPDTFYVRIIEKVITADACGSLTTPYGLYPNVLREHEYVITVDSIYGKIGSTVVSALEYKRDTANNYMYLSNGVGYPVCTVHADKNNFVKDVEYYAGVYSGVNDRTASETKFSVYPNPSDGEITIEIPSNDYNSNENQIFIYNSVGALIWHVNTFEASVHIDASDFPKGIYFIRIMNKEKTYSEKIILQ